MQKNNKLTNAKAKTKKDTQYEIQYANLYLCIIYFILNNRVLNPINFRVGFKPTQPNPLGTKKGVYVRTAT